MDDFWKANNRIREHSKSEGTREDTVLKNEGTREDTVLKNEGTGQITESPAWRVQEASV